MARTIEHYSGHARRSECRKPVDRELYEEVRKHLRGQWGNIPPPNNASECVSVYDILRECIRTGYGIERVALQKVFPTLNSMVYIETTAGNMYKTIFGPCGDLP